MNLPEISIIIPAYNEEQNIAKVIEECQKLNLKTEIIVVDGGSSDRTSEIAREFKGIRVITLKKRRGKGVDFWSAAKTASGKYVIQIDADLQFSPSQIPLFLKSLKSKADVAIATRFDGGRIEKNSISNQNYFGNQLISLITSVVCGRKVTDVMAGFKGFRKDALTALNLSQKHFEYEAEIVIKASRMGMDLVEIPVSYKKRYKGSSQVRALRDGFKVLKTILVTKFMKLENYKRNAF